MFDNLTLGSTIGVAIQKLSVHIVSNSKLGTGLLYSRGLAILCGGRRKEKSTVSAPKFLNLELLSYSY